MNKLGYLLITYSLTLTGVLARAYLFFLGALTLGDRRKRFSPVGPTLSASFLSLSKFSAGN
jgi:hypothetical protein